MGIVWGEFYDFSSWNVVFDYEVLFTDIVQSVLPSAEDFVLPLLGPLLLPRSIYPSFLPILTLQINIRSKSKIHRLLHSIHPRPIINSIHILTDLRFR
jgi:hypothetical protein